MTDLSNLPASGLWRERVEPACWAWPVPPPVSWPSAASGRQMQALEDWQAGRCALCETRPKRLVYDHDHDSDVGRGLLCDRCNTMEGWAPYPAFEGYRRRYPALILGLDCLGATRPLPDFASLFGSLPSRRVARRFRMDRLDALREQRQAGG